MLVLMNMYKYARNKIRGLGCPYCRSAFTHIVCLTVVDFRIIRGFFSETSLQCLAPSLRPRCSRSSLRNAFVSYQRTLLVVIRFGVLDLLHSPQPIRTNLYALSVIYWWQSIKCSKKESLHSQFSYHSSSWDDRSPDIYFFVGLLSRGS